MSVHDVFGTDDEGSVNERKELNFDNDMESGDLTMDECSAMRGEYDPMPHIDGHWTDW